MLSARPLKSSASYVEYVFVPVVRRSCASISSAFCHSLSHLKPFCRINSDVGRGVNDNEEATGDTGEDEATPAAVSAVESREIGSEEGTFRTEAAADGDDGNDGSLFTAVAAAVLVVLLLLLLLLLLLWKL